MEYTDLNLEPYLHFYPSPGSYSTINDQGLQSENQYSNNDDYAMLSSVDSNCMLDTYLSTPFTNEYIPNQMMLLQKSYSESQNLMLNPPFSHLSREQLIKRVVQLEMEKTNKDEGFHSCLWVHCSEKASTLEKLMTHICEQHIGSGKAIYFCEWQDCPRNMKPFMKRHKMHNHMRTHTGERPFVCTVIGCSKTFSRPDSLSTHIKTHSDIRPYSCSVPGCEKAYFHSRSLRKHVKSCHLKTPTASVRRNTPSNNNTAVQKKNSKPLIQSAVVNTITPQLDYLCHPYPRY